MATKTVLEFLTALDEIYRAYVIPSSWTENIREKTVLISNILIQKSKMYPNDDPRNLAAHLDDPVPDFLIRKDTK